MAKKILKIALIVIAVIIVAPFLALGISALLPAQQPNIPVGNHSSYNPTSFWHPWGDHKHRGVDLRPLNNPGLQPSEISICGGELITNGKIQVSSPFRAAKL